MTNLYATLGIDRSADAAEVRKAYRRKVSEWHPDKHENSPESQEKFRQIQHAYEILSDDPRRKLYDVFGTAPKAEATARAKKASTFKSSGNVQVDLVRMTDSLAGLTLHTIKHGLTKNVLLIASAITMLVAAPSFWTGLLAAGIGWSMWKSGRSWIHLLIESPIGKTDDQ